MWVTKHYSIQIISDMRANILTGIIKYNSTLPYYTVINT